MPRKSNKKSSRRTKLPKTPKTLAPKTSLDDPGGGVSFIWIQRKVGDIRVTHENALTFSAVWACVRVIAEAIAALPWHVFEKRGRARDPLPDHPADFLLSTLPNPEVTAFTWRETMLAWALTWGGGFAEIERDAVGRPVGLWQLPPNRVTPARTESGRLVYAVSNKSEPDTILDAADVFHLKGLGFDGLVGYSVIEMHSRSIGTAMAADANASQHFENDSSPGGILKTQKKLGFKEKANLQESWEKRHKGTPNRRRVAVLEGDLEWIQTGLPPNDSQLLETRQFSATEVARIFKVPPHKIGDLTRATFSNVESEEISFQIDTLLPWAIRLEQEANAKLFNAAERGKRFSKLNMNARLRADSAARAALYQFGLDRGVWSINDILEKEDQNPVEDGDARFVPLNMQLLETAANPPEPEEPEEPKEPDDEAPDEDTEETPQEEAPEDMARSILTEALSRIVRREHNRIEDSLHRKVSLAGWAEPFAEEHARYALEVLRVPIRAVAHVLHVKRLPALAGSTWAVRYKNEVLARAAAGQTPPADAVEQHTQQLLALFIPEERVTCPKSNPTG